MKVMDAMTRSVAACNEEDTLNRAAQLMWEGDCGCIPVLDAGGDVRGILTDRDVCMAAYTQGLPLQQIPVRRAMSTVVAVPAARRTASNRHSPSCGGTKFAAFRSPMAGAQWECSRSAT